MKLTSNIRIELPYAIVVIRKEGIIHLHYKNHALTLEENKAIFDAVRKNSPWEICPFLISGDEFSSHDKESKEFNASAKVMKHCSAFAFVTKNIAQKLVVNFFMRVYHPKVPMRLFSSESKALEWLIDFDKEQKLNPVNAIVQAD